MESSPWTISICGVTTRFQGSSSALLVCRCVVMTVILSPSKCFLFPQCPASHFGEEATPTRQKPIHSFLLLGAFLFGVAIAACRCQSMTRQGLGHHMQLLDMWMRFHQEVLHFTGLLFLEPEQALQNIDERCCVTAYTELAKVLIIASTAVVAQLDGILFLLG